MSATLTSRPRPLAATPTTTRPVASLPVVAALLTVLAGLVAGGLLLAPQPPTEDSADVGFARDMSRHHAQAVAMAEAIRERTQDPELRSLTQDIALTQQAQIGMMSAWLDGWGYSQGGSGPAMAWMGMPTTGLMPGMATPEQVAELRSLPVDQAEDRFLSLMVAHHAGGVDMAKAGVALAEDPQVVALAQGIAAAQTSEIEYLQSLRTQRGLPPAPVPDAMAPHGSSAAHDTGGQTPKGAALWTLVALGAVAFFWLLVDSIARRAGAVQRPVDVVAGVVTAGAIVSSAVHLALTPMHAQESPAFGLFFALSALALAFGAAVVLAGRPIQGSVLVSGMSVLLVVTYVLFRVVPAPGADAPEGVDAWGVIAVSAELVALAAFAVLLRRREPVG